MPLDLEWSEFDSDGVPAVHHAHSGGPKSGTTKLQLVVDQLDDIGARRREANVAVERSKLAGVGEVITARSTSGTGVQTLRAWDAVRNRAASR